jgi:threonylcarbamoyladenosine tRNA methylthiotransferase MtaB
MEEALLGAGFSLVDWDGPADVRVINTCTVTAKSDRTCRHQIRHAKRLDPGSLMVVTGCYAQIAPDAVAAISGVDLVLGNPDKLQLPEHIARCLAARSAKVVETGTGDAAAAEAGASADSAHTQAPGSAPPGPAVSVSRYPERACFEGESFTQFHGYTRAFLKIQTGCDSRCAYCIIPAARGPARSMPAAAVLDQVRLLGARGYREVVLTGIDLGNWGSDTGEGSLAVLLASLLADTEARQVGRFRLSSTEPLEIDAPLLDVIERAGDRVAHHFHLPLQSGSDTILRRMGRPYSAAEYLDAAAAITRRFPDAALGADVIVGFPGETEVDFQQTLALVERSPLTYLHVFAYSDRPGTRASGMKPKVNPETIQDRSERLRSLGAFKKAAFRDRLAGTEQRVLVLRERAPDGRHIGLTGNYMEVLVSEDEQLVNSFVRMQLQRPLVDGRWEAILLGREEPCG